MSWNRRPQALGGHNSGAVAVPSNSSEESLFGLAGNADSKEDVCCTAHDAGTGESAAASNGPLLEPRLRKPPSQGVGRVGQAWKLGALLEIYHQGGLAMIFQSGLSPRDARE
jgi:hypothetical protein